VYMLWLHVIYTNQEFDSEKGQFYDLCTLVDGVVLLHDNARPHVANRNAARLQSFGWEIMEHSPYSPDLAPSDYSYHVFGPLKKSGGGSALNRPYSTTAASPY
jgi:hypothetical protein